MLVWLFLQVAAASILFGNPGELSFQVTPLDGTVVSTALRIEAIEGLPCDPAASPVSFDAPATVDASSDVDVTTYAGDFCFVRIDWGSTSTVDVDVDGVIERSEVTVASTMVELSALGGSAPLTVSPAQSLDLVITLH
ncbi:MAG: hypothetical protein AAF211_09115 [Myxococcota bacterium]